MIFQPFNKIPRLSKQCVITEKIDGTNASITITEDGKFLTASRKRWITPQDDNYGFSRWAHENKDELMKLGVGTHFGEWWGKGIQRCYDMDQKVFSLFNVHKWSDDEERPKCCRVVPTLITGEFSDELVDYALTTLWLEGSQAAQEYMKPEGIVIYHTAAKMLFKKTFDMDGGKHGN